ARRPRAEQRGERGAEHHRDREQAPHLPRARWRRACFFTLTQRWWPFLVTRRKCFLQWSGCGCRRTGWPEAGRSFGAGLMFGGGSGIVGRISSPRVIVASTPVITVEVGEPTGIASSKFCTSSQ